MDSLVAREAFTNRSLYEKFRFVRDILVIPFSIDEEDESEYSIFDSIDEDSKARNSSAKKHKKNKRNILGDDEKQ